MRSRLPVGAGGSVHHSISIQGVIERVEAATSEPLPVSEPPPAIPFQFVIVSLWFNSGDTEETVRQRVRMAAPDGKVTSPGMETADVAVRTARP